MSEYGFPFPAIDDDRVYDAADWAAYFAQFITNGVFPVGTQLQVTAGAGMQINISVGAAWINGYGRVFDTIYVLDVEPADGVLDRIDRIVVRWGRVERAIFLDVRKGTAASSPTAPALVRDADHYDLCLAEISIPAGITEITGAHISDKRLDTGLCGIVSSLITPDTDGFFESLEAEFLAWFNAVKDIMDGDPDTNIVNDIAELQEDVQALEAINAPLMTGGTAPDFTISPSPAILGYADGQIWTVQFHAESDAPTLNVNGKGAAAIYQYTSKAAKVKAGQIARVMRLGSSFFTVSGGGIGLPLTIGAGDTPIRTLISYFAATDGTTYASAGRGFTAYKAGTYRFVYSVNGTSGGTTGVGYVRLLLNGVVVPDSEYRNPSSRVEGYKTIDVALEAGDVIVLQLRTSSGLGYTNYFSVSVLASDFQEEFNTLGILNAG